MVNKRRKSIQKQVDPSKLKLQLDQKMLADIRSIYFANYLKMGRYIAVFEVLRDKIIFLRVDRFERLLDIEEKSEVLTSSLGQSIIHAAKTYCPEREAVFVYLTRQSCSKGYRFEVRRLAFDGSTCNPLLQISCYSFEKKIDFFKAGSLYLSQPFNVLTGIGFISVANVNAMFS